MNEQKSIYAAYEKIKQREISELKERLRDFGGEAHFGLDYVGEGATGTDNPIVMCNLNGFEPHPADVKIMYACINPNDVLCIYGCEKMNSGGASWYEDEVCIPIEDIAYGQLDFITSAIPTDRYEPNNELVMETAVILSADMALTLKIAKYDWSIFEVAQEIISLARQFERELNWQSPDDDYRYLHELQKFEEKYLKSLS